MNHSNPKNNKKKSYMSILWKNFVKIIVGLITGAGIIGALFAWLSNKEDREANILRETISLKRQWQQQVTMPINDLRYVRVVSRLHCKFDKDKTDLLAKQQFARSDARFKILKSATGIKSVFGIADGELIDENIRQLIKFDEKIDNVCATGTPPDDYWLNYLMIIDQIMEKSIELDIKSLNSK